MALEERTKLGQYEIRSQIGAGGMGVVYLARETKLDRNVAIKVLAESMAREENLDRLLVRMDHDGLRREDNEWNLDLRRYGSVPHGGFGLGVERIVAWLCGLKYIREAILFPRMMGKLYP